MWKESNIQIASCRECGHIPAYIAYDHLCTRCWNDSPKPYRCIVCDSKSQLANIDDKYWMCWDCWCNETIESVEEKMKKEEEQITVPEVSPYLKGEDTGVKTATEREEILFAESKSKEAEMFMELKRAAKESVDKSFNYDYIIKDSGERSEFETGAVRDTSSGKGRYDLLPPFAIMALAKHYEAGCQKYGDRNWEKGIPLSRFIDSAERHIAAYKMGLEDEAHLTAAAWNVMGALDTVFRIQLGLLPDTLDDLPRYLKQSPHDPRPLKNP